jgi:dTDP-glucose 4,6-dehydratase
MKGLILTGCAGFIGLNFLKQNFVDKTRLSKYEVIVSVDKLGYATTFNQAVYSVICKQNGIIRVDSNINDIEKMKEIYNPCSQTECHIIWDVLDFASESHVDNSITNPWFSFTENAMIPSNLIQWIGGVKKINKYFHISTDEVYGDIEYEDAHKKEKWFTVNSPIKPSNPYSASKVAQDMFLHSLWKTFGLNVTLIRMANQFGPYQHIEKMIPASIKRVLEGDSIKVYGSGKNMRQWTWVEETVKMIYGILINPMESNNFDIYHLSDERNLVDNNTITKYLVSSLSKCGFDSRVDYIEDRKGHDKAYALVSSYSNYSSILEKRIDELVKWYIDNRRIYNV